jgi:hypothetical protein
MKTRRRRWTERPRCFGSGSVRLFTGTWRKGAFSSSYSFLQKHSQENPLSTNSQTGTDSEIIIGPVCRNFFNFASKIKKNSRENFSQLFSSFFLLSIIFSSSFAQFYRIFHHRDLFLLQHQQKTMNSNFFLDHFQHFINNSSIKMILSHQIAKLFRLHFRSFLSFSYHHQLNIPTSNSDRRWEIHPDTSSSFSLALGYIPLAFSAHYMRALVWCCWGGMWDGALVRQSVAPCQTTIRSAADDDHLGRNSEAHTVEGTH